MANNGVWVFYFLQGEDGDSAENPNAFNVSNAMNEVRFGQFLQYFPLRGHGRYHFRFRAPDPRSGYCWLDLSDPSAVLPRYDNAICAKALRLDRLPKPRPSRLRRKAPHGLMAGGSVPERAFGSTSWRNEKAERHNAQEHAGVGRGHWHGQGQGRTRSASPAHQHHFHADHQVPKGKSATPPPSHGSGTAASARPPPPPPPPKPENLESFLFSDSPTGSPTSSSSVRETADFPNGKHTATRSSSGGSSGSGGGGGGGSGSRSRGGIPNVSGKRTPAGPSAKSGDDLLNFGHEAHGTAPAPAQSAPRRPTGRSSPPPGWGNRPATGASGGTVSPGRKSTAGRMQSTSSGGGAARSHGAGVGGGGSSGAGGQSNGDERRNSFSGSRRGGSGGGGPDLMNVNANGGGGGVEGASAEGKSASARSKAEERESKLEEATKKALRFKQNIDKAAAKDQEALDAAKSKYDAMLTAWAEDHGKKRNIRTLLSTMHTVLWEGNRWKPVAMGDILQPSKVKGAYRRSMLLVHPDKCGSLGPDERLIARRVFEAVNEAYTIFAEKEMS